MDMRYQPSARYTLLQFIWFLENDATTAHGASMPLRTPRGNQSSFMEVGPDGVGWT